MKPGRISWYMARQMWRNGKDTAFIAEHFGKSEAFVYNGLLAHGSGENHFSAPRHRRHPTALRRRAS